MILATVQIWFVICTIRAGKNAREVHAMFWRMWISIEVTGNCLSELSDNWSCFPEALRRHASISHQYKHWARSTGVLFVGYLQWNCSSFVKATKDKTIHVKPKPAIQKGPATLGTLRLCPFKSQSLQSTVKIVWGLGNFQIHIGIQNTFARSCSTRIRIQISLKKFKT